MLVEEILHQYGISTETDNVRTYSFRGRSLGRLTIDGTRTFRTSERINQTLTLPFYTEVLGRSFVLSLRPTFWSKSWVPVTKIKHVLTVFRLSIFLSHPTTNSFRVATPTYLFSL